MAGVLSEGKTLALAMQFLAGEKCHFADLIALDIFPLPSIRRLCSLRGNLPPRSGVQLKFKLTETQQ
jgi:hypothetical protein